MLPEVNLCWCLVLCIYVHAATSEASLHFWFKPKFITLLICRTPLGLHSCLRASRLYMHVQLGPIDGSYIKASREQARFSVAVGVGILYCLLRLSHWPPELGPGMQKSHWRRWFSAQIFNFLAQCLVQTLDAVSEISCHPMVIRSFVHLTVMSCEVMRFPALHRITLLKEKSIGFARP